MLSIIPIDSKLKNYHVEFIDSLDKIIHINNCENTIVYIDENVSKLYPLLDRDTTIKINCIEDNKNLFGCQKIFESLVARKANINTKIIAIGGGILQDLVGFCASTFCRGIEYILVPTTLLSQVDSCIGGKTSLNFQNKKNILGTFYPPTQILIYEYFNKTLSNLDLISGFGEIYKFRILQNKNTEKLFTSDLMPLIYDGLSFKAGILKKDEFDLNERKILNFGHTFGHALEAISLYNIPHGIAVIIGSMIALRLSKYYEYNISLYDEYINTGIDLIHKSNIKLDSLWFNFNNLIEITKSDKKNTGQLNMILINNDKPIIKSISNIQPLERSIRETYESL